MNNAILRIGPGAGTIIGENKIGEAVDGEKTVVDGVLIPIMAEVDRIITVETRGRGFL
jgi:hypothetical protein